MASVNGGPDRDAKPLSTQVTVYHGFRAQDIIVPNPPSGDTVFCSNDPADFLELTADPVPNLADQDRIRYKWIVTPLDPLAHGSFPNGNELRSRTNQFRADYPGDVQIQYKIRDIATGYESEPSDPITLHLAPTIELTSPAPDDKFVFDNQLQGSVSIPATVTVVPQQSAFDLIWSITEIQGSDLTITPLGNPPTSVTIKFDKLPQNNEELGEIYIKAAIPAFNVADSVLVKVFFTRGATNHQGGTLLTPNWYHYWSDALNVDNEHSYNGRLATSQTTVFSEFSWIIQIGSNADWPPPGNPPTNNDYIDGFWATNLHEFWHRDHRVHNFAVHGSWDPPVRDDRDGDGICDRDPFPGQPGQYAGGWEALIGTDPDVPESTEEGGRWAERQGTYGHDDSDWAYWGSQWRY